MKPLLFAFLLMCVIPTLCAAAGPPMDHHVRGGIPFTVAKLGGGEPIRIAYVGGSITEADGYRPMTTSWLRERFPKAEITEVNAAVSGTGSLYGVFRFDREVLAHEPDLIFIEFAVNDNGVAAVDVRRAMEGMARKTWALDPSTDIVFLYTVMESYVSKLSTGELVTSMTAMEAIADHYRIPSVFVGAEVVRRVDAGTIVMKAPANDDAANEAAGRRVFSRDGVHPLNEPGHRLYTEAIARFFDAALVANDETTRVIPASLEPASLERARLVLLDESELRGTWDRLPAEHPISKQYLKVMPEQWIARSDDASLTIRFRGTAIGASDFTGPASGHLLVSIDGEPPRLVERFNSYSHRYRRRFTLFADKLPQGEHELRVTLAPGPLDKSSILAPADFAKLAPEDVSARHWLVADLAVAE